MSFRLDVSSGRHVLGHHVGVMVHLESSQCDHLQQHSTQLYHLLDMIETEAKLWAMAIMSTCPNCSFYKCIEAQGFCVLSKKRMIYFSGDQCSYI